MAKEINAGSIRRYNLIAGFFHLAQMAVVLILANDFSLPIVARYMAGPPGSVFAEPITLLDTPVGHTVAIFLGLSAFFHFLVASPQFFTRYAAGLAAQRTYFRWVEYSISSSVMIAAGLKGIEKKYVLEPSTDNQLLPSNLEEAILMMEKSELVRETLGEHVFDYFLRNKRAEWQDYRRQVSAYELDRYLPVL